LIYGIYKNVRNAAWQCLIDYGISSLPVDLLKIANSAGIKIIKNSEVGLLSGNESGACIFDNDIWYLVYDDEATLGRRRVAIAHEMGHIFLGHEMFLDLRSTFSSRKPQSEIQADAFASRLLAPSCILWSLDLHTAEEIAEVCSISIAEAKKRAERMVILYERDKFLTSSLEIAVFEQFEGFIIDNRWKRK